jgi:hypothetical protein
MASISELIEALKGADRLARSDAAYQLAMIGPLAGAAIPELANLLIAGDLSSRTNAAFALGRIGSATPQAAAAALVKGLKDDHRVVRCYAVAALGEIVPAAETASIAVPALAEVLSSDSAAAVRLVSALMLGRFGRSAAAAVSALSAAASSDFNANVRDSARVALRRIQS